MDNINFLPDYAELKSKVLNWLNSMRISAGGFEYKFSPSTGSSLCTTCFAIYILDLFKETDNLLSKKDKNNWASYINSFQREKTGLFHPDPIYHPDKERAVFQASCFCLSALSILGSNPKYRLSIVNNWQTKDNIENYLIEKGCHLGKPGSGNKAMFQAIFLTHEYEKIQNQKLLKCITNWFDFHNRHQNRYGFWGKGSNGQLYSGLQNAFHQFVIYEYWRQNYPLIENVCQTALKLQGRDGFFSNLPGGSACKDYDSLHFLLASKNCNSNEYLVSFKKVLDAIKSTHNDDGGFCENIIRPIKANNYGQLISFIISGKNNKIRKTRCNQVIKEIINHKKHKNRGWIKEPQPWGESTLWDTWFRCLSIAEVSCFIDKDNFTNYRFHTHIGLGFNQNQKYFN